MATRTRKIKDVVEQDGIQIWKHVLLGLKHENGIFDLYLSNHRIKSVSHQEVTIAYKDYKDHSKTKELTLKNEEFVRRFSMHILPKRFVRIRHYGILSSS